MNGKGEESLPLLHSLGGGYGAKHHGFTIGGDNRTVGLTGNAARLQGQLPAAPHHFLALYIKHLASCLIPCRQPYRRQLSFRQGRRTALCPGCKTAPFRGPSALLAKTQLRDKFVIAVRILALEIGRA